MEEHAEHGRVVMPPVHRVPAFTDNYIWLLEHAPGRAAVIDPGDGAAALAAAGRLGLAITDVLITHWHPDHTGGIPAVKAATGARVVGPAREAERISGLDVAVDEGDVVTVGDMRADVLFVGAHTAGHIAFAFPGLLFPGDTIFAMGCGRLFEGTPAMMHAALAKLMALPAETRVFCAHEYTLSNARFAMTVEPDNAALAARYAAVQAARAKGEATVPFTLADEAATNPFVRAASVERLAALRSAKDAF